MDLEKRNHPDGILKGKGKWHLSQILSYSELFDLWTIRCWVCIHPGLGCTTRGHTQAAPEGLQINRMVKMISVVNMVSMVSAINMVSMINTVSVVKMISEIRRAAHVGHISPNTHRCQPSPNCSDLSNVVIVWCD